MVKVAIEKHLYNNIKWCFYSNYNLTIKKKNKKKKKIIKSNLKTQTKNLVLNFLLYFIYLKFIIIFS